MTKQHKEISEKYQLLDEIEHVLKRPGMYIGSTKPHTASEWILTDGMYEKEELTYNPGFLKLFDEIISNSVDEHKRHGKLNLIKVHVTGTTISVLDNGGIPVIKHTEHKQWIPEMIFSNLRAGSNFDDDESRVVAGTNGIGATAVNIFSKRFVVETADGKNRFLQIFTDNMSKKTDPKVTPMTQSFTEITYEPDLDRFGLTTIDEAHVKMMRKRVIDIAASNPGLRLEFNKEKFKFKTFKEYVDTYVQDSIWEKSKDWEIAIGVSKDGFQSVSFVNSIETKEGGTHENYILYQAVETIRAMIKKKHKVEVKPAEIRAHMFLFMNCTIVNPAFDSQTKTRLITEPKDFGTTHKVSDKFNKALFESEVVQSLLDWIEQKKAAEERTELRKLNKSLGTAKVLKLIDAKGRDRQRCVLGIFEGNCLHEDTLVKRIKRETGEITESKIKDIMIGDYVISRENKIEEVYQISKKIQNGLRIKTKNNAILIGGKEHRLFVYSTIDNTFDFVKIKDLDKNIHKLVRSRLSSISSIYEIDEILEVSGKIRMILESGLEFDISPTTKVGVFDRENQQFLMILSKYLIPGQHLFIGFSEL